MQRIGHSLAVLAMALVLAGATAASADPFSFSAGEPDGRMATASRPESHGKIEIESQRRPVDAVGRVDRRQHAVGGTGLPRRDVREIVEHSCCERRRRLRPQRHVAGDRH